MRNVAIAVLVLALAACDAAEDGARTVGSGLKQNYDTTRKHLSQWIYRWSGDEATPPPPHLLANAYCYNVRADILCYEQPQTQLGTRLVAYQGSTAYPPGFVAPMATAQGAVASRDLPPPFAPASDETMARTRGEPSRGGMSGPPTALMRR